MSCRLLFDTIVSKYSAKTLNLVMLSCRCISIQMISDSLPDAVCSAADSIAGSTLQGVAKRRLCYQSTAIKIQLLANSQECGIQRSLSAIAVAFSCLTIYLTNVRRAVKNLNEISEVVRPDTVRRIQDAITRFKFCEWKIVVLSLLYSTSKYNAMEIFLLR